MLRSINKNKKKAIVLGAFLGLTSFVGGSLLVTKNTNAAVLVHDDENIAQAIETVTNTYNILTNLQKQLLIDILNNKKLDAGKWLAILKGQAEAEAQNSNGDFCKTPAELSQSGELPGVLNRHSTPTAVMASTIGRVQDVINGNNAEFWQNSNDRAFTRAAAVEASLKDTAQTASNVQYSDAELAKSIDDALEAANNAEGIMQVEQANAVIAAAQVRSIQNGNLILAQMAASTAQVQAANNMEDTMRRKAEQVAHQKLDEWVKSF